MTQIERFLQADASSERSFAGGDPPASPCPSAIGFASGGCRAGLHGGQVNPTDTISWMLLGNVEAGLAPLVKSA